MSSIKDIKCLKIVFWFTNDWKEQHFSLLLLNNNFILRYFLQDVALDIFPSESDIGIGSIVLFPQGSYGGTENNNSGGVRYHQGKVTEIYKDSKGINRLEFKN